MDNKRLVSGIQPTGELHLGNYLGAIKNWVALQDQYQCIFFLADLHAITVKYDPAKYQDAVYSLTADLLACGLDPNKVILFPQSKVPAHSELSWLLTTIVPVTELQRMTQYKDKIKQNSGNINAGLLLYPILQAADILLYRPTVVPVGEDQLQHLELTNVIVKKFNHLFGRYFSAINPLVSKSARLRSLADPNKKMSKSLGSAHCLYLQDKPEVIKKKVMKAVTDTGASGSTMTAGVINLFNILETLAPQQHVLLRKEYDHKSLAYAKLKNEVADAIITLLAPIQKRRAVIIKDRGEIGKILKNGTEQANHLAEKTLTDVKRLMGLV
jgi:tryptophanyl-tRNA synthetase